MEEIAARLSAIGKEVLEEHNNVLATLTSENKLLRLRLARVMSRDDSDSGHGTPNTLTLVPSAFGTRLRPRGHHPSGATKSGGRIPVPIVGDLARNSDSASLAQTTKIDEIETPAAEFPEDASESAHDKQTEYDRISNMSPASPRSAHYVLQDIAENHALDSRDRALVEPIFTSGTSATPSIPSAFKGFSSRGSDSLPAGFKGSSLSPGYKPSSLRGSELLVSQKISNLFPQSLPQSLQASNPQPLQSSVLCMSEASDRRTRFSDGETGRESLGSVSSFSGAVGVDIFPEWFNPYNQQTYLAKQPTLIDHKLHVGKQDPDDGGPKCVVKPIGRGRLTWDLVWTCCLTWEIWITPIDFVFIEDNSMPDGFRAISYVTLAYFCADILLNFFTGYMDGDREILDKRLIARNYLKFWFWIDFIATLPWDGILGGGSEKGVSTSRAAKFSKAFKVLKMAKLLRIMKVARHVKTVRRVRYQRAVDRVLNANNVENSLFHKSLRILDEQLVPLKQFVFPCLSVLSLIFLAHMHIPFYAFVQTEWSASSDIDLVLSRYYESFWWCFSQLTFANPAVGKDVSLDFWTLAIIMLIERIFLTFHAMSYLIFRALVLKEDDARMSLKHTDAMAYLKSHDVSVRTQVQVLFNVNETGRIHKAQRHFLSLMENEIPTELQRQVYEELWSKHLSSFGLLWQISQWNTDFITELCQLVTEECYASKVIIFKEGDAAIAAYRVLQGQVVIASAFQTSPIPMFTKGMWLGEKALVTSGLRRSATGFGQTVCHLMVVPSNGFQMLLDRLCLLHAFQNFCSNELWKGLCGRCGSLGDHFGHECPTMQSPKPQWKKLNSWKNIGAAISATRHSARTTISVDQPNMPHLARDLKMFLAKHRVDHLTGFMEDVGIESLDDLHDAVKLEQFLSRHSAQLKESDIRRLTPSNIDKFKTEMAERARGMLSANMSQTHHWLFLSHYKVEAGTEAALMRAELESLIWEDNGHPAKELDAPIFLDSEDLTDLVDLLKEVSRSHNLVLMLTKGIFTRPWCIIEIATAVREGVSVIPITINKKGAEFSFPDEEFYSAFKEGKILGPEGTEVLEKHGFDLEEASDAIRRVLKRIAVPYSPHRTAAIRKAEIQAVLRNCTVREIASNDNNHDSLTTNDVMPTIPGRGHSR